MTDKSFKLIEISQGMGLYVHIPFCSGRCSYCDFLTFAHAEKWQEPYLQVLNQQIKEAGRFLDRPKLDTLYFGGGTPSLLSARQWAGLLASIDQAFDLSQLTEATVESNPGSLDLKKLAIWRDGGINRISFGVQSFDDQILKTMGRRHGVKEIFADRDLLDQAGFDNMSIDLIYGFQGQGPEEIDNDLRQLKKLGPQHVSTYQLIIEEGTQLDRWIDEGKYRPLTNDQAADLGDLLGAGLEDLGYARYEISNFAQPGFESGHNLKYWTGQEYLGLGLGASSYINRERWQATSSMQDFLKLEPSQIYQKEERDPSDDYFEDLMMGLRLSQGINLSAFARKHGQMPWALAPKTFQSHADQGLIKCTGQQVYLTKRGLDLQNVFLVHVLEEMDS